MHLCLRFSGFRLYIELYDTPVDIFFVTSVNQVIMVALCNRADHYILPCDFYLSFSFFFFSFLA